MESGTHPGAPLLTVSLDTALLDIADNLHSIACVSCVSCVSSPMVLPRWLPDTSIFLPNGIRPDVYMTVSVWGFSEGKRQE